MADTGRIVHDAIALFKRGQAAAAQQNVQRALTRDPRHPGANQFLAVLLAGTREYDRAKYHIARAIEAEPTFAEFYFTLASILSCTPDHAGAIAALERTLSLDARHVDAMIVLGTMLGDHAGAERAEAILREALRLAPERPDTASALAKVLADQGRADEAVTLLRETDRTTPNVPGLLSSLCLMSNYVSDDGAAILELHRRFGRAAGPEALDEPPAAKRAEKRPLRVGYLSPDFRRHAVACFVAGVVERHDRSRVLAHVYHTGGPVDEVTERVRKGVPTFRLMYQASDEALRDEIKSDGIDILVELSGHSSQHRLTALSRRLAPVQVTYVGYPATTGVSAIDWRIVDSLTDPPGAEVLCAERLMRLPTCFLCYEPMAAMPEPSPPPSATGGPITFGSFNNPAKVSESTVSLWASLLRRLPGSRLLLKGRWLGELLASARMRRRFEAAGVEPGRVECLSEVRDATSHLELYSRIDIALDPLPYNGTTTTCEALWMGVPVVSLVGRVHAGRVGLSLLTAAGLGEWAADSPDRYIDIASELASDRERLAALRRTLRGRVAASALCDAATRAREMEDAYERMWSGAP
ncbi:MAG: tetratricopeptide repeat protein [Phycisphaerales bacterium]